MKLRTCLLVAVFVGALVALLPALSHADSLDRDLPTEGQFFTEEFSAPPAGPTTVTVLPARMRRAIELDADGDRLGQL